MNKTYIHDTNFEINTAKIYRCLRLNTNIIPRELIITFRDNLEESMIYNENIKPEIKFSKASANTCKRKFNEYSNSLMSQDPFIPSFFINQVRIPQEELTPAEEKVFNKPPIFEKLGSFSKSKTPQTPKKTLTDRATLTPKSLLTQKNTSNEPEHHWWAYNYDIYSFAQENILAHDFSSHEYQYFFAWYIGLLDPYIFQHNIKDQIIQTFNFDNKQWVDYINMLAIKFNFLTFLDNWTLLMKHLESDDTANPQKENNSKKKQTGRPKKDFMVSKPIKRSNTDNLTILNNRQTSILFNYLKSEKVILQNPDVLTETDLSKLISCLTGYNDDLIRKNLSNHEYKKEDKIKLRSVLQNIINLINRNLG